MHDTCGPHAGYKSSLSTIMEWNPSYLKRAYTKSTHMHRCLDFTFHHPLAHKITGCQDTSQQSRSHLLISNSEGQAVKAPSTGAQHQRLSQRCNAMPLQTPLQSVLVVPKCRFPGKVSDVTYIHQWATSAIYTKNRIDKITCKQSQAISSHHVLSYICKIHITNILQIPCTLSHITHTFNTNNNTQANLTQCGTVSSSLRITHDTRTHTCTCTWYLYYHCQSWLHAPHTHTCTQQYVYLPACSAFRSPMLSSFGCLSQPQSHHRLP